MRPIFRDISVESIVRNIRSLISTSDLGLRKSTETNEKADDASSKPSTKGLCQECSQIIKSDSNFTAAETLAKDTVTVYDAETFDDLPDFPILLNSRRKTRRGTRGDEMV
ncbi:hypothetical protein HO173_013064 [Letharia columbiana]|uniref:Uncharacterized protein n=1 Tax=Letharia columbiana TaxID=112416 RepID=A0A8H6CIM0_9LECA|nr:uncharacterized protein HO173_013064 [Letharia columbiana]KAF6223901.1 hypothetical protein HO173_013064 [Letharia columbiana]